MVGGIQSVLLKMDPTQQYVALATIHKSKNNGSCVTEDTPASDNANGGKWVPVPFSNNYVTGTTTKTLNAASTMVKGLNCMPASEPGKVRHPPGRRHQGCCSVPVEHGQQQPLVAAGAPGNAEEGHHLRDRRPARRGAQRRQHQPDHQRRRRDRPQLLRQRQRQEGLRQLQRGRQPGQGGRDPRHHHRLRRRERGTVRASDQLLRARPRRRALPGCATTCRRRPRSTPTEPPSDADNTCATTDDAHGRERATATTTTAPRRARSSDRSSPRRSTPSAASIRMIQMP